MGAVDYLSNNRVFKWRMAVSRRGFNRLSMDRYLIRCYLAMSKGVLISISVVFSHSNTEGYPKRAPFPVRRARLVTSRPVHKLHSLLLEQARPPSTSSGPEHVEVSRLNRSTFAYFLSD